MPGPVREGMRRQRLAARTKIGVVSDAPQSDDDASARQRGELLAQEREAGAQLLRSRLVLGRRALERGREVDITQDQPVVLGDRGRLVGKARPVQRLEEEVARLVA